MNWSDLSPRRWPVLAATALIWTYRVAISPLVGPSCRFEPTCSEYGLQAFDRHGFLKGFWLTVRRVARCHPYSRGGYDPVP